MSLARLGAEAMPRHLEPGDRVGIVAAKPALGEEDGSVGGGLADAARSRSEADWLVGINGTRAMTAFNSRDGGFFLTTVGRVPDRTS